MNKLFFSLSAVAAGVLFGFAATPVKEVAMNEFHRGMSFGFYAENGYFGSAEARAEVDAMAETGIKWVVLIPMVWQEGRYSPLQFNDYTRSQNDIDILDICDYIHAKGMRVMLRPMLECYDGTDRMYIDFENDVYRLPPRHGNPGNTYCSRWFESMKARTVYYARVAQRCGCEAFCIDSELDRMAAYAFNDYWKGILTAVREVYTGALGSCHTGNPNHGVRWDECLPRKDFWLYDLDFLQLSDYPRATPGYEDKTFDVETMVKCLEKRRDYWRKIAAEYGKPMMFGEFGCTSSRYGARSPAVSSRAGYDGEEQANFMEAFFRVFWNEKWCRGFYWWKWENHTPKRPDAKEFAETAHTEAHAEVASEKAAPKNDPRMDHVIKGKPAQEVLRMWYRKPDPER